MCCYTQNPETSLGCFSPLGHSDVAQKLILPKEVDHSTPVGNEKAPKEAYPEYHHEHNQTIRHKDPSMMRKESINETIQFASPQGPPCKHFEYNLIHGAQIASLSWPRVWEENKLASHCSTIANQALKLYFEACSLSWLTLRQ